MGMSRENVVRTTAETDKRMGELIVYIAQLSVDDPHFGATKLNKILFFADFFTFARYGASITSAEYMKLHKGPAPRRLILVKEKLMQDHSVEEIEMMFFGRQQKRLVAKRPPNLDLFSGKEISMVEWAIALLKDHSAASASELSHKMVGWKIADIKETIPYTTSVLLPPESLTESDFEWAQQVSAAISNA